MMKKTAILAALLACGQGAARGQDDPAPPSRAKLPIGHEVGKRIPRYRAQALDASHAKARPLALDTHALKSNTLLITMGVACPGVRAYAGRIRDLDRWCTKKGIQVFYIYPNAWGETHEQKIAFHAKGKFPSRMVDDAKAEFAKLLKCRKTAEAIYCDAAGKILYRGGFDDNVRHPDRVKHRYLAEFIEAHLAGAPLPRGRSAPPG